MVEQTDNKVSHETYPMYTAYRDTPLGSYCFSQGFCVPVIAHVDAFGIAAYVIYEGIPLLADNQAVFNWLAQRGETVKREQAKSKLIVPTEKPSIIKPGKLITKLS